MSNAFFRSLTARHVPGTRARGAVPVDGFGEWQPWAIDPAAIESGDPRASVVVLTTSPDRLFESGAWSCTAGRFRLTYGCDEFLHIVEGEARVRRDARWSTLRAGDSAYFPAGLTTTWDVPALVRKVWVMRYPDRSFFGRLARCASLLVRRPSEMAPRIFTTARLRG